MEPTVLESIRLLPPRKSFYGAEKVAAAEKDIGRKLNDEERRLLDRKAAGGWRKYSDDLIEFEVPDDPILKVEPFDEEVPAPRIMGDRLGTGPSFVRGYRMTFNGLHYGTVLVNGAAWFDEEKCYCGPVDLKSFVAAGGNLLELSQLPDGRIKKVQAINGRHRAVLFEWTHSVISQEAYVRIGASIRLKPASDRSVADWRSYSMEQRKDALAGIGWLRVGTPVTEVVALLGEPQRKTADELYYESTSMNEDGSGYLLKTRLPVRDGKLQRFGNDWTSSKEARAWIKDTLRSWLDSAADLDEGTYPNLPEEDVKLLLDHFHENAATAVGEEWDELCQILQDLANLGVKDEKACLIVVKRFSDNTLPQFASRWVLELYEVQDQLEMFHRRLEYVMKESRAGECHNLFSSLEPETNERSRELLRQGLSHQNDDIREDATYFLDGLPREEAVRMMKEKLKDPAKGVRRWGILHVDDLCSKADEPWLRAISEEETSERNRTELLEKIGKLK
jgi:hypothetical protein